MIELIAASILFLGSHILMSAVPIRTPLVGKLGPVAFMALYSIVAIGAFSWMIHAYIQAPVITLFDPGVGLKHLTLSVMAVSCFLIVCGYTQPNATAVGMERSGLKAGARGVLKITRHPVMWGVALWALCHGLANGHAAALVFFGAMAFLAIAGASHIDKLKRAAGNKEWDAYMETTSHVPLMAIIKGKTRVERGEYKWWQILLSVGLYMGLLISHEEVIGRYVMPF